MNEAPDPSQQGQQARPRHHLRLSPTTGRERYPSAIHSAGSEPAGTASEATPSPPSIPPTTGRERQTNVESVPATPQDGVKKAAPEVIFKPIDENLEKFPDKVPGPPAPPRDH